MSCLQIQLANEYTKRDGLESQLRYEVADALNLPFPDNHFDLAWSMESGEHMPDKIKFMTELVRVIKPEGRIIIVTWCRREDSVAPITAPEQNLLDKISDAYYLPHWVPPSEYVVIAEGLNLQDVRLEDWTEHVKPFWGAVIRSSLTVRNIWRLMLGGRITIKAAIASFLMKRGIDNGVIKLVIMTAKKNSQHGEVLSSNKTATCVKDFDREPNEETDMTGI